MLDTLSSALHDRFTMINPIRSGIACFKYTNSCNIMRNDGVKEFPGTLSKVAIGIGWGLPIAGGVIKAAGSLMDYLVKTHMMQLPIVLMELQEK